MSIDTATVTRIAMRLIRKTTEVYVIEATHIRNMMEIEHTIRLRQNSLDEKRMK